MNQGLISSVRYLSARDWATAIWQSAKFTRTSERRMSKAGLRAAVMLSDVVVKSVPDRIGDDPTRGKFLAWAQQAYQVVSLPGADFAVAIVAFPRAGMVAEITQPRRSSPRKRRLDPLPLCLTREFLPPPAHVAGRDARARQMGESGCPHQPPLADASARDVRFSHPKIRNESVTSDGFPRHLRFRRSDGLAFMICETTSGNESSIAVTSACANSLNPLHSHHVETLPAHPRFVIPIVAGIGNALLAMPMVRQIKERFPGGHITILARINAMAEPFRRLKEVDEVLVTGKGIKGLLRNIRWSRCARRMYILFHFRRIDGNTRCWR